jgi:hypothetical protein
MTFIIRFGRDRQYNQARPHSALGYRTPEEFAKSATARNCGKDAGCARLENAARFPLSHSLDGYEKVVTNVASETQNPEKVSLSLDLKMGGRSESPVY